MSLLRRVVLDTGTLVGAARKTGSVPHQALLHALARCDVGAPVQTWLELEHVMRCRRFDRCLERETRLEYAAMLRTSLHFFAVTPADEVALPPPCHDTMDNKFLALVPVREADDLISSDDDLQVLSPWRGVPALRPVQYLSFRDAS